MTPAEFALAELKAFTDAKNQCPVSGLVKDKAEITLDAARA